MSKLALGLLCILLAMWAALGYAVAVSGNPFGASAVHPVHAQMQVGGERFVDDASMVAPGMVLAGLIVLFFTGCLTIAVVPGAEGRGGRSLIALVAVPWVAVFAWLFGSYKAWRVAGETEFLAGFPISTFVMVLLWAVPLFFVAVYCLGFRRWFVTDEQVKGFEALMERNAEASRKEAG